MDRPDWNQYYMDIAHSVAKRSTCLRRSYGAIIVKNHRIISTGYNGAMRGESNCNDEGVCYRQKLGIKPGERYELCKAVHAEQNAIINANPIDMVDATIYISGYLSEDLEKKRVMSKPCLMCARMIRNAQLNAIVFFNPAANNIHGEFSYYYVSRIADIMELPVIGESK